MRIHFQWRVVVDISSQFKEVKVWATIFLAILSYCEMASVDPAILSVLSKKENGADGSG